jgi:hypothetical protein
MAQQIKSSNSPTASVHAIGTDADDLVLQYMQKCSIPLTRQNWIDISYPEGPPKDWGAELESEVPKMFQRQQGNLRPLVQRKARAEGAV